MPLMKGKSEKAFKKNIKTEYEAGKPLKQSLAIAYAMKHKSKGKKMADGGPILPGAQSAQTSMRNAFGGHYADGGEVKKDSPNWKAKGWEHGKNREEGVHNDINGEGESYAGSLVRKGLTAPAAEHHENNLSRLKSMPNPKLKGLAEGGEVHGCKNCGYAEGGRVGTKSSDIYETTKGSLPGGPTKYTQGFMARFGKKHTDIGNEYDVPIYKQLGSDGIKLAKEIAAQKSFENSKIKPKLKGLAHGGEVHGCKNCGYAEGGQITDNYQPSGKPHVDKQFPYEESEKASGYMDHEGDVKRPNSMAMKEDDMDFNQKPVDMRASTSMSEEDMVDRIMKKRSENFSGLDRYSEGGKVANQEHGPNDSRLAGFSPNEFDDLVLRDDLESSYTGANSGDYVGNDQEDEDRKDIVARIMASRKKKDRMPNPA